MEHRCFGGQVTRGECECIEASPDALQPMDGDAEWQMSEAPINRGAERTGMLTWRFLVMERTGGQGLFLAPVALDATRT